jgi:hypothetical protein
MSEFNPEDALGKQQDVAKNFIKKKTKWIKSGDQTIVRLPLSKSSIFNRRLPISTLFVGPYTHEFGHELFSFQGYAREISKLADKETKRPYEKIIVSCREGMEFLYEDFATDFLSIEEANSLGYTKETKESSNGLVTHISEAFCRSSVKRGLGNLKYKQSFIKYGENLPTPVRNYDIVFHARRKETGRMSVNLSDEDYKFLYENLSSKYKIAFVGLESQSYCPQGAIDLRGLSLSKLTETLRSSRLIVGQSSGPIHFASLCGTPHLTWGGYRYRTFLRYAHYWNPFRTPCYLLESLTDGYLEKRVRIARLPKDTLDSEHFNVIDTKKYRHPPAKELLLWIEEVLISSKLNEYDSKRLLRDVT